MLCPRQIAALATIGNDLETRHQEVLKLIDDHCGYELGSSVSEPLQIRIQALISYLERSIQ